ncbi:MAG: CBS domain-containing protein, partial [Chthoniobacterales bacterium]
TVSFHAPFAEIAEKFVATRINYIYVLAGERFLGAVSLHDIKNYLNSPDLAALVIAGDILRDGFPFLRPDATLNEALENFSRHEGERLPVVSPSEGGKLLGSIAKTDIILALAGSTNRSATTVGKAE